MGTYTCTQPRLRGRLPLREPGPASVKGPRRSSRLKLLSQWGFGTRVRPFATHASGDTPLRTMVFGPDRPPDPDALLSAQIAANKFPGESSRRLAETATYPDPIQAAAG